MYTLKSQKVVVTGATGGIARAIIRRLIDAGADVIVSARSADKLSGVVDDFDGAVDGHVMDLTDRDSIRAFFESTGPFDHLVTPAATSMFAPIRAMDFDGAREIVDTKQWGQLLCVHYGSQQIAESGSITFFSGTVTQNDENLRMNISMKSLLNSMFLRKLMTPMFSKPLSSVPPAKTRISAKTSGLP